MRNDFFAVALRRARQRLGLTQEELAGRCRMRRERLSHLENGRRRPGEVELMLLADELFEAREDLKRNAQLSAGKKGRPPHPAGAVLRHLVAPPGLYVPKQRVPTFSFVSLLRKENPALYRRLWLPLRQRRDWRPLARHLARTTCDSRFELLLYLWALESSGRPTRWSPCRLGFDTWPLVDPETLLVVGHRPTPGYLFERGDRRCVLVPQPTLHTRGGPHTVDAIGLALFSDRQGKFICEVDGGGHDSRFNRQRRTDIGLPEIRLTEADLLGEGFLDVFWSRWDEIFRTSVPPIPPTSDP